MTARVRTQKKGMDRRRKAGPKAAMTSKAERGERLREKIIKAARVLFSAQGYAGTSTDEVAAAVPISKRTLYNHFPSKEALFRSVIMQSWSWLLSPSSSGIGDARPGTFEEASHMLRSYGEAVLAHWQKPGVTELIRLVIGEAHQFPEIARAFLEHGKGPAVTRLAAFLSRVHELGIADVSEPTVAAWQFHGMLKETVFLPRALGLPRLFSSRRVIATAVASTLHRRI